MDRRQLLKQSALAAAAFAFSRDAFSRETERSITRHGWGGTNIIKLSSNENPHGPSPASKSAMMAAVSGSNRYPWEVTLKSASAMREVMIGRGVNAGFGRALAGHLRVRGLEDISAEGRMHMWQGKSLGTHLMKANLEQLREAILGTGSVTALEFEDDLARLDQEDFMTPSPVMWSVAARRRMN